MKTKYKKMKQNIFYLNVTYLPSYKLFIENVF